MSTGVLMFAFNNGKIDYFKMAALTATRVKKFLNLPVTVITDEQSASSNSNFEKVIIVKSDLSNYRAKDIWINKGRYQAFDLSPYDETILLDTDYMVNSSKLLSLLKLQSDFVCHKDYRFIYDKELMDEFGRYSPPLLWATVVRFRKTERVKTIFHLMKMIQENYEHYAQIYDFPSNIFRNDFALSIALHVINGHLENMEDYIPWKLIHCDKSDIVERDELNEFTITRKIDKVTYIKYKDCDFHMLGKTNFLEIA